MPDFEGVSQETFDQINNEILNQTQEQQEEQIMAAPPAPEAVEEAPVAPEAPAAAPEPVAEEAPEERVAGQDGTVRDVYGAVVAPVLERLNEPTFMTQASDAVAGFLGMGTPEERQKQREEGAARMQKAAQEAIDRDPVGAAVADTLVRAVPGALLDTAEDVLSAGEVVGDTARYFATLGNVSALGGDPETDNPFSSNYDWVQWKLGADEIGAQTTTGKFAQELVGFAALASRLGGFKSFGGAAKATTRLGKAGQVAKSAGMESLYGMATDAIKGLAGEGNFANMLEELVPGLKDTWVTALAVDEDDNPWESAVKSALDGAAIGFPTGVIGSVASATRASKGLPVEEQQAKFVEVFAEKIEQTELPLGVPSKKPLGAHEVFMEMSDGDFSRASEIGPDELRSLMKDYDLGTFASQQQILGEFPFQTTMEAIGQGVIPKKLKNGSTVEWLVSQQENGAYRLDWDMSDIDAEMGGLGEGGAGVEMFQQVRDVIKEADLPPGTIIETEAAADGVSGALGKSEVQARGEGKPSVRERLYKRAGFSEPDENGIIRGIVRAEKKGRKSFQPLDMAGDVDAQIAAATELSAKQMAIPAMDVIAERVKAGVPVYWDDVANTVPEMFTPGTRVIENPEFPPEVLKMLRDPGEGVTVNPFTGEVPPTGTMVAIDGKSLTSFEPEDISDFIAQNYDILTREDVYLGGWVSEITGKPVVELSRRVENFEQAKALGEVFDQEGVFRMDDFSYHGTGGIDRLKETQGMHMKSAYTTKNYVRQPGDAQSIAAKQFTPGAPNGAIGGRIMTDEQLHLIGDALPEKASKNLEDTIRGMDVRADDIVADSKITRAELWERVSDDLSDFIDGSGRVDLNKLPTIKYGDDSILTREGALQTRVLIQNIAGTIWDEARMVSMKDGQTIDTSANIEVMVDGLKALSRLRKKTVNIFGVRLADEGMKLESPSVFKQVFSKEAADKAQTAKLANMSDESFEQVEKALDEMVAGFKSGDPKRIRQAKRTAEFLQLTGGDPVKMAKVAKGIPALYADVALKHMYNSLLSSPATHIVSNLSNFTNTVARPMQAALGGRPREALASFYNFGEMLHESFDLAVRTWSGENLAQGSKIASTGETRLALDNLAEKVQLGTATPAERINSGILHMLYDMAEWPVLGWPSKFLTTSDEFFKAMNARMEYRVQNYMEAADIADGDPQKLFKELMEKNKQTAFGKKSGSVMDPQLLDVAQELTFQNKLEGPAGRFAAFVNENPLLRPFFPFVKTGHNIMVFTGTHTPVLNLALSESRRALRGELGPYAQAVHRGRLAMGGMTMAAAGMALAADRLTGAGPAEKKARESWLRNHQPRSIKIGDRWYSYDRIEPFGQILSAVADIHFGLTTGELEEDRAAYRVNYLIYALSTNFSDKTFFQGVKDIATLLNPSGPGVLNRLQTIVLGTANNFLPAAGLRRATFNTFTPYMQEYHNMGVDRIKQQMGLPVEPPADKVDFLDGSKVPAQQGGFSNAILPIKSTPAKEDVVRDSLAAIEFDQASVRKELGDIKLTPTQSARLNELMSQTGLYKKLEKIVSSPKWVEAVKDHKEAFRKGESNVPKQRMLYYSMVTDEIRRAQKIALDYLLEEDYELQLAYYNNKQVNKNAKMGQIEGLLQNPNR